MPCLRGPGGESCFRLDRRLYRFPAVLFQAVIAMDVIRLRKVALWEHSCSNAEGHVVMQQYLCALRTYTMRPANLCHTCTLTHRQMNNTFSR